MIQDFVQHMGTELRDWFIYWERSLEGRANTAGQVWSEELIDGLVHNISNGMSSPNSYGRQAIDDNIEAAEFMGIKGKRVLVVGSEWPWLEASLLVAGADHVVTLEYRPIRSLHPKVTAISFTDMREKVLSGNMEAFDAVFTFSSVEHSGLGRYGDVFNPWGDLMTVARAWCVTKPGGALVIGVPYDSAEGTLVYNAHRIYGPDRFRHLAANYDWAWAPSVNTSRTGISHMNSLFAFRKRAAPPVIRP